MAIKGFSAKFNRWISILFSSSTSRIQINNHISPPFTHKRGLRQGDPLFPYLFILPTDVFQQMTKAVSTSLPYQLTPKVQKPVITFQYADNTILMVYALGPTICSLLLAIHCFSLSSGLMVNFSKSSFVPLLIPAQHLNAIEHLLSCKRQPLPITYLDMPLSIKTPKREDFLPLVQKLERHLEGWRAQFISTAVKLQLVRTVLSTIPTYYMSCFRFPKWLVVRIDAIRRQFLWSKVDATNSIHLLNWPIVCFPVANGGLWVVNLYLQNILLLIRWWWKIYALQPMLWNTYTALIYVLHQPG